MSRICFGTDSTPRKKVASDEEGKSCEIVGKRKKRIAKSILRGPRGAWTGGKNVLDCTGEVSCAGKMSVDGREARRTCSCGALRGVGKGGCT